MSDYDLQFQQDLEKAQALSLETLALEQFRRQKVANSDSVLRQRSCSGPSTGCENPPALPPPPRQRSRVNTADDTDLISFTTSPSKDNKDPHASIREYINRLGQQTEDLKINTNKDQSTKEMNNQYFNNRPPGYVYPNQQYAFNYQHSYTGAPGIPPYPVSAPYHMPVPMQNYNYYTSPTVPPQEAQSQYPVTSTTYTPYQGHPRMVAPSPYVGYPPPAHVVPPHYSYNPMPNVPTRPVSFPQVGQSHNYPTTSASTVPRNVNSVTTNAQNRKQPESTKEKPDRNSVKPEFSRKLSEASVASNESNDTVGSLPKSSNLIDFGRKDHGSVRVSVLEAFDPLLTEQNNAVLDVVMTLMMTKVNSSQLALGHGGGPNSQSFQPEIRRLWELMPELYGD
ncbi:hypothetical protein EVAR_96826_1 [Eumeta japonica]|uniref:Uncharacterized protein n=1 Tax=Eumeta variegata TaxID=151549 RepID=A0A4C1WDM0_EUMVA|nr:hypothetical protein EVAR_96826_1 [Eumeta japonica]